MSASKIAIVTGSNRGIGLAIVKLLSTRFNGDVYLTARNLTKGKEAVDALKSEGLSVKLQQLDIDNQNSIKNLHNFVLDKYGGLDVLINNAGIKMKSDEASQARPVMNTNFYGTMNVSKTLLPIIKPGGRVVNIAGFISAMAMKKCSPEVQDQFRTKCITEEELIKLMEEFVESAEIGKHVERGFADMPYGMSKIGVAVLSRIHAQHLRAIGKTDVLLNSCCPGWVRTDMGGPKAPKSPQQGAETPVHLALLPEGSDGPHGEYVAGKRIQKW